MITLRPPKDDEHAQLVWLRNENKDCFFDNKEITLEQHLKWYDKIKDTDYFFVIDLDNKLIGTISLYNISTISAEYGRFVIDAVFRGNGYGREALVQILEFARTLGIKEVYGEVWTNNTVAIALDKSLGFVEEQTFEIRGRSVTRMVKNDILAS